MLRPLQNVSRRKAWLDCMDYTLNHPFGPMMHLCTSSCFQSEIKRDSGLKKPFNRPTDALRQPAHCQKLGGNSLQKQTRRTLRPTNRRTTTTGGRLGGLRKGLVLVECMIVVDRPYQQLTPQPSKSPLFTVHYLWIYYFEGRLHTAITPTQFRKRLSR